MTDLRAAAEMALEYLEYLNELDIAGLDHEVHTNALRQALAQSEQAIGDIRALKHRIHELEGEVIGYKRILDAQPEQDKDNLNETNQALIELCEALNDALVEVCSANPKIEISRKHDQRIKNATAKIKELT